MEKLISSIGDRKYQIKQLQEITDEHNHEPARWPTKETLGDISEIHTSSLQ